MSLWTTLIHPVIHHSMMIKIKFYVYAYDICVFVCLGVRVGELSDPLEHLEDRWDQIVDEHY